MQPLSATSTPIAQPVQNTQLQGQWRALVQLACGGVAALAVMLFGASLPINFAIRSVVCATPPCLDDQLRPVSVQSLHAAGLTPAFYATYYTGLEVALAVVFTTCGVVIALRKPTDWLALFVALMLVTFGAVTFASTTEALTVVYPGWWWMAQGIAWLGDLAIMLFFFIFPTGHFAPRWLVMIPLVWALMQGGHYFLPNTSFDISVSTPTIYSIFFPTILISGFLAQLYRYRYVSHPAQRQQTKWVVFGVTTALGGYLLSNLAFQVLHLADNIPTALALGTVQVLVMSLIPLSVANAVLRHRLWEIDPIINRTLVYTALTVSVILLYMVVVGALGALFQTQGNFTISMLATGIGALLFEPLRNRLQRGVNRLMYGERDDPYTVIARLGQRLESALVPEAILPTVVETVCEALKLPYALVALPSDANSGFLAAAESGTPRPTPLVLPLIYQGEPVGQLRLAERSPGESFDPADLRLLTDLAHQAGVAAHAVRLTLDLQQANEALQRSRERIITAREEERRRLRRDLHDGLGPALVNLTLQVETARELLASDPMRADALLAQLSQQAQAAISDIRRLVYDLRPPALDELGLVSAVREQARQYEYTDLQINVLAPEALPPLPAAVEVAAYRIVQEALTNVVRHAQAKNCAIRLALVDKALGVEIQDDGVGLSPEHPAGVGLHSMSERAAELGGDCTVQTLAEGGAQVTARLPIMEVDHGNSANFIGG